MLRTPVVAQNDQAASQEQASPNNPPGNTPGTNNSPSSSPNTTDAFKKENYLTGDWGGVRQTLFDDGLTFTPVYVGEVMGNPSGGARQGIIYEGLLNVAIDFDLGKMSEGAVSDLTIHAIALEIHGPSLSLHDTGDFSNTSSIAGYNTLRLDELWIQKSFFDQHLSIKAGNIAADTEFFQSSSAGLFVGATFGAFTLFANNIPNAPAYPLASPGVRIKASPTEDTYLLAAAFSQQDEARPSTDNQSGTLFPLSANHGLLFMAEGGYLLNQGPHDQGLQGSYRLGATLDTGDSHAFSLNGGGADFPASPDVDYSIYGVMDQQLYVADKESISLFVRAGGAPQNANFVNFYCDGGLNFAGFIPGRPDDIGGVAIARSKVSPTFSNDEVSLGHSPYTAETFLEASYRIQLNPWWSAQPFVQYIVTPSGEEGSKNATVLGLRSSIAF